MHSEAFVVKGFEKLSKEKKDFFSGKDKMCVRGRESRKWKVESGNRAQNQKSYLPSLLSFSPTEMHVRIYRPCFQSNCTY